MILHENEKINRTLLENMFELVKSNFKIKKFRFIKRIKSLNKSLNEKHNSSIS